jgi:hypothetical protein
MPALVAVRKPPRRESTSNMIMQEYIKAQNEILARTEQEEKEEKPLSPRKGLKPQPRSNRIVLNAVNEPVHSPEPSPQPASQYDNYETSLQYDCNAPQQHYNQQGSDYGNQDYNYNQQSAPENNYVENQSYYNNQQYVANEQVNDNYNGSYAVPSQQPASNAIPLKNVKIIRVVNSPPQQYSNQGNYY